MWTVRDAVRALSQRSEAESPTQFHSAAFVRDKLLDKWRFMAQKMGLMRVSAETLNKGFPPIRPAAAVGVTGACRPHHCFFHWQYFS